MDPLQTIVGIDGVNNALVLELYLPDGMTTDESAAKTQASAPNEVLASKLKELITSAKESYRELTELSSAMQKQASLQDEHNESVLALLETHLKGLESSLRDEIQCSLRDAMNRNETMKNSDASPDMKPSAKCTVEHR